MKKNGSPSEARLRHDVRVPFATVAGVLATLIEEPDMDSAERAEFLEILEQEVGTCMALNEDLLRLRGIEGDGFPPGDPAMLGDILDALDRTCQKRRSMEADSVAITQKDGKAAYPGGMACWILLATKLIDHGLTHSDTGDRVSLEFGPNGCELSYRNRMDVGRDLSQLSEQIPSRAGRRRYVATLGMGLFVVGRLVEQMGWDLRVRDDPDGQIRIGVHVSASA